MTTSILIAEDKMPIADGIASLHGAALWIQMPKTTAPSHACNCHSADPLHMLNGH